MTEPLPGMPIPPAAKPKKGAPRQRAPKRVSAFGAINRGRLLDLYFSETDELDPSTAWKHIYRLLLSIDRTIGLAHCYESNRCQPGQAWYVRSLAFHGWVAEQLGTTPADLANQIDWLFRRAIVDLAGAKISAARSKRTAKEREPYEGRGFPEPGDDPELAAVILNAIEPWLAGHPPQTAQQELVQRVLTYVKQENKRRNLIGEAFEDSIAAILRRIPSVAAAYEISTRVPLHNIRGFSRGPVKHKQDIVDLVLIRKRDQRRLLITAKWSVRADREKQFDSEYANYASREDFGEDFDYICITNEFDSARLVRACERRSGNQNQFTDVVHVQPEGPALAYRHGGTDREDNSGAMYRYIANGRLSSFEAWVNKLSATG
jgi:hypothetical protein